MQRISTSATLLLKFFIPTFWCSFFGALTLAILFAQTDFYGRLSVGTVKIVFILVFLIGLFIWWKTVMGLKRMEADEEYLYISNYFKTFRYPFDSIANMEVKDRLFFKTLFVSLKETGTFGQQLKCVISEKLFTDFMLDNPKIAFQFGFKPE